MTRRSLARTRRARRVWPATVMVGAAALPAGAGAQDPTPAGTRGFDRAVALEDSAATSANVSIGDVNGDGHLDIVLVKGRHWPLENRILPGDGAGGFAPAYSVGSPADRSYSGVLGDLDGDGDPDLVVSNDSPDAKLVLHNDGRGRFTVVSTFGRPEWNTRHVAVADLDGDGRPDAVLANRSPDGSGSSSLCFGVEGGGFDPDCRPLPPGSATTITPADLDGDGDLDLVVPHRDGGQSRIHLNDGSGGFDEVRPFGPPEAAIRSARVADFDGDGVPDLVVIDERAGAAILRGSPGAHFGAARPLGRSGARPYAVAVADLDEDGRPDVLVGYVESRPIAWFNDGPDGFTPVPFGDDEGVGYGFAVGDLDEDGVLDVAVARSGAPNMLYLGTAGPGDHPSNGTVP